MKRVFQITLDRDEVVLISALITMVDYIMHCDSNGVARATKWIMISARDMGQDRYRKLSGKFVKTMDEVVADDAESKSEE